MVCRRAQVRGCALTGIAVRILLTGSAAHLGEALASIDRVYDNALARRELGWETRWTFDHALERLAAGAEPRSPLAAKIGFKGYHAGRFPEGRYPVD